MVYMFDIEYPVESRFGSSSGIDSRANAIASSNHGDDYGAGSGFGVRDIQFGFPTKKDAKRARADMVKKLPKFVDISEIYPY